MQQKHSPGPWYEWHNPVTTRLDCCVSNGKNIICEFIDPMYRNGLPERETLANARLIAKSPEMLSLLHEVMEDLNSIIDNQREWGIKQTRDHCFWIQGKIHDLIEKVEE